MMSAIIKKLKGYFDLRADLDDLDMARQQIVEGVSFRGSNILILIMAIFIASLGLNTNSPAVIIGAMLISPLMGPIIGLGLGVGTYDFPLIRRAVRNLAMASAFSVLTAAVYFLISPVSEGHSELLARTSPTIYDVLIGFFGGAAGIIAIACKNKGNVIPGVAIATALMPPLCTVGYGLATWQMQYMLGALYLFVINSIFIAFATLIGVKLFKFKEVAFLNPERRRRVKRVVVIIVVLTVIPSVYLTFMMLRDSFFKQDATEFVDNEFNFTNTQVFSKQIYTRGWEKYIDVTLIGDRLDTDSLTLALTQRLDRMPMLKGAHLTIHQGIIFNSGISTERPDRSDSDIFNTLLAQVDRQRVQIDSLRASLYKVQGLDSLAYNIAPEVKVLYPQIKGIAIRRMLMCDPATNRLDTLNVAIIEVSSYIPDREKMRRYLETRTGLTNLQIYQPGR